MAAKTKYRVGDAVVYVRRHDREKGARQGHMEDWRATIAALYEGGRADLHVEGLGLVKNASHSPDGGVHGTYY